MLKLNHSKPKGNKTMKKFIGFEHGINLGGWLSQCGDGNYTEERYNNYILKEDIENIASWGLDHVRLPIDYNVIMNDDGSFIEHGFTHIDRCLDWCFENNLNVVIDLHKTLGYVFDDVNYCDFFSDEKMQDIFVGLWREIIRRYAKYGNKVAFELLNEITTADKAVKWNEIAKRTIKAIREISSDAKIIIGGIFNSSLYGLTLLDAPYDENIVFTFHCYSPLIFTHQAAVWIDAMPQDYTVAFPLSIGELKTTSTEIFGNNFDAEFDTNDLSQLYDAEHFKRMFAQAHEISEKYNVPMYCGEYGVIDKADSASTLNWYKEISKAFDDYEICRCAWSYKLMDFGITQPHCADIKNELIECL